MTTTNRLLFFHKYIPLETVQVMGKNKNKKKLASNDMSKKMWLTVVQWTTEEVANSNRDCPCLASWVRTKHGQAGPSSLLESGDRFLLRAKRVAQAGRPSPSILTSFAKGSSLVELESFAVASTVEARLMASNRRNSWSVSKQGRYTIW